MMGMMLLFSVLLLGLIAGGIWLAVRAVRGSDDSGPARRSSASEILEERFARGEIDREKFEERRRTLGG